MANDNLRQIDLKKNRVSLSDLWGRHHFVPSEDGAKATSEFHLTLHKDYEQICNQPFLIMATNILQPQDTNQIPAPSNVHK